MATIAARVEAMRGLKFERAAGARSASARSRRAAEGLSDLDRSYPEARRRADEEVLKLLGLIEPDVDLRAISGSVFGEGVAGYYDPRSKRLRLVDGRGARSAGRDRARPRAQPRARGPALRAGARRDRDRRCRAGSGRADRGHGDARHAAVRAALHRRRSRRWPRRSGSAMSGQPDLPKFVQDQLIFPYIGGLQFAAALQQQDGGGWTTLDDAAAGASARKHRADPAPGEVPGRGESRTRVRLKVRLGSGWRRATAGTWGEWQTAQLVGGEARGVGRRPLRALAARLVRRAAVSQRGRAGDAVGVGHAGGRSGVRGAAARRAGGERRRRRG